MKNSTKAILLILGILIVDQGLKFWVKLNMLYGEEFLIFSLEWARIHFVENEGMAFGLKYGGKVGKVALTVFRLGAVSILTYIIINLIKSKTNWGVVAGVSMIFAGAFGNIIDSVLYGMIFSESHFHDLATLFPEGGGYAPILMGKVVDMFYFPLIHSQYPEWIPFVGGEDLLFFRPVFNVADSAIFLGITYLLLFRRSFFRT